MPWQVADSTEEPSTYIEAGHTFMCNHFITSLVWQDPEKRFSMKSETLQAGF